MSPALRTLLVVSAALFMTALDNLIVTVALPSIRQDLGATVQDLEWTVNAYTLTFAVLLIPAAALGDRFGRGASSSPASPSSRSPRPPRPWPRRRARSSLPARCRAPAARSSPRCR